MLRAPGLGVLAKKPDAKWSRTADDIVHLAELQAKILDHAATLVKPGGALVYSTCTIEPEENSLLVAQFLTAHPEYVLEPATAYLKSELVAEDGTVHTFRHVHGMDGSFCARLRRSKEMRPGSEI
jgi:16S rRNA (cytosine967-C5)-methyltransferase